MKKRKEESLIESYHNEQDRTNSRNSSEAILIKLRSGRAKELTSKDVAVLKKELLNQEEEEEKELRQRNELIVRREKQILIEEISRLIDGLKVELLPQYNQSEVKVSRIASVSEAKLEPEFELVKEVLNEGFIPNLIFDATKQERGLFKPRIAGQPNLMFLLEMQDGLKFGVYLPRQFSKTFGEETFMVDKDAFVFWVNERKVFRAADRSYAQYDVSPDYLLSVGNTMNWDGFWL